MFRHMWVWFRFIRIGLQQRSRKMLLSYIKSLCYFCSWSWAAADFQSTMNVLLQLFFQFLRVSQPIKIRSLLKPIRDSRRQNFTIWNSAQSWQTTIEDKTRHMAQGVAIYLELFYIRIPNWVYRTLIMNEMKKLSALISYCCDTLQRKYMQQYAWKNQIALY